ncbi:hypothetical protein PO909_025309, partial [Leuciscus waleckii]
YKSNFGGPCHQPWPDYEGSWAESPPTSKPLHSGICNTVRTFRLENRMTRRPSGGGRQRLSTQQQELAVVDLVRADNAIRLHQLRQKILADRQVFNNINHVSITTIRRILGKHNITMKQLYRVPFERNSVRVKGF